MATSGIFTGYAAVQDYLFSLKARGLKFGVDRMRVLVEALGHPERRCPVVHVAGTNGKGSVAAMLDAILHTAGWRTGLYTSPHLVKLGERVQVNRQLLGEAEIIAYTNELRPVAEQPALFGADDHPSFFEFMTAMAFLQFARQAADLAVIEVGLGGRLDATNVVEPEVTAITSIGFDHCDMLGDRLELIAAEREAPVTTVREVYGDELARYPQTNLEGDYQRWNAATATLVARLLPARWGLTDEIVARGLMHANWPGRWQRITLGGRPLILDASHNPEGAQVLDANLTKLVAEAGRKPIVVTGALGEYRARALLEVIARHAGEIHLAIPHQARACGYGELEHSVPAAFGGRVVRTTVGEVFPEPDRCAIGSAGDTVVVTGSIYLIGEVFERIEPGRGAGEGRLQDF